MAGAASGGTVPVLSLVAVPPVPKLLTRLG